MDGLPSTACVDMPQGTPLLRQWRKQLNAELVISKHHLNPCLHVPQTSAESLSLISTTGLEQIQILAFFDIFHLVTLLSSFSTTSHTFLLPPFFPGHPERETAITFHQRLCQYYSSISSKLDRGYWSLCKRRVEIVEGVCVCVCVVQLRAETTDRQRENEPSVWPLQSVSQSVCEVWLPEAMGHSFISIKLTCSFCPRVSRLPLSFLPLSTPCMILILLHTTRGPCVHNKQNAHNVLPTPATPSYRNRSVDVDENIPFSCGTVAAVAVVREVPLSLWTNTRVMMPGQREGVNVGVLWRDFCSTSDRQAAMEPKGQVDTGSLELQGHRH